MQAIDALLTRRSAGALTEPPPDDGALDLILASAMHAPDHGRLRPWRFVLVRSSARARFGELLADHLHPQEHPAIRLAKDCAAAGVLIASLGALGVALALLLHLLTD